MQPGDGRKIGFWTCTALVVGNTIGMGIFLLPASLLVGWLWSALSPVAAFAFGAVCAFAAALLLRFWVFRRR